MTNLGRVFCSSHGVSIVIGFLGWNAKHEHAMLGMDLAALLPACRACQTAKINAACIPEMPEDDGQPLPYLGGDLQVTVGKVKRERVGYVWTMDSAEGKVIYQVRIDVEIVLRRFGVSWWHVHELSEEELKDVATEKKQAPSEPEKEKDTV